MITGFVGLLALAAAATMGVGVVWLIWRTFTPTELQASSEAERRAAADREAAFRRGTVAERSAVVRLLNDLRAKATDADQKDGLGRIVGMIQSGGHVAARRGET